MVQQITQNHQRSRNTQLIFTYFLLFFSLLILLLFPFTSYTFQAITPQILTSQLLYISNTSIFIAQNGSGLILATQGKVSSSDNRSENGSVLVSIVAQEKRSFPPRKVAFGLVESKNGSCDIFDGRWVLDNGSDPIYSPGSCPYLDYAFNCFNNGRSDVRYLSYRWQPFGCDIPRFDGKKMLEMVRGKRMVFVGDSLSRNMWESMICALRMSVVDKRRVFEVSGRKQFRTEGFYAFKFQDYNCTIEFIRSPFLVQEWKSPKLRGAKAGRETLRLDMMQATTSKYTDADFLIFNTGHWWTHHKTKNGENFYQEGSLVHRKMKVTEAFQKALQTWAIWVDTNVNRNKTKVFFVGYSSSHFRGGQWNSGGNCNGETEPITNDKFLAPYPWMMKTLESVITKMSTPVVYLNITKMTGYRKDGHPSIFRQPGTTRRRGLVQDCSHWCLPGVPDSWNQLLYASLLGSSRTH